MPELGLCMTVRNEAANVVECLGGIAQQFAEIVVIDTGSTDNTRELLRDELGIDPVCLDIDPSECLSLAKLRNHGFDQLRTPWLMTLDADERVDSEQIAEFSRLSDADLPDGLFCRWPTHLSGGIHIDDYKLSLFRNRHRHVGLIHDTAQPSLRGVGCHAEWYPGLSLQHYPDCARREAKDGIYSWRLQCARRREPNWFRYHWFSGYLAYRQEDWADATELLKPLHERRPELFPVESLNASMILSTIAAKSGHGAEAAATLVSAIDYFGQVADDFEVRVNFRLGPWLHDAYESARAGRLDDIQPYLFPY